MAENYQIILQELVRRSNEETRRLKTVEQRLDSLEDKVNIFIEGEIERTKKSNAKLVELDVKLGTIANEAANIKANVEKITKQLSKFAQRRDLKEIEHMLQLLTPVERHREKEPEITSVRVS